MKIEMKNPENVSDNHEPLNWIHFKEELIKADKVFLGLCKIKCDRLKDLLT